ncbi:uncharacterized protein LOC108914412 [Anoplophora glabripennis]|uniref:uncharacterized protein LOC108914412 n=1 Tax=Anoplophora glabripennis TaxID=217634 RepID=UPI000873E872|nr:uncharacterized protein LOC108914412 [Anoplophora glabripennis]
MSKLPSCLHSIQIARCLLQSITVQSSFARNKFNNTMQLIAAIVILTLTVWVSGRPNKDLVAYRMNYGLLSKFPCKQPQPRVFELEELMNNNELMESVRRDGRENISPAVTVLHRCESIGCCNNPHERCTNNATEEVTLTFRVITSVGKLDYVKIKERNHTQCACMMLNDNVK